MLEGKRCYQAQGTRVGASGLLPAGNRSPRTEPGQPNAVRHRQPAGRPSAHLVHIFLCPWGAAPRAPVPDDFLRLPTRSAGRNSSLPAEYCGCDISRQSAGESRRCRRKRSPYRPPGNISALSGDGCGPSTRARCQQCVTAYARMVAALLRHRPRARCCRTLHSSTLGHNLRPIRRITAKNSNRPGRLPPRQTPGGQTVRPDLLPGRSGPQRRCRR